MHQISYKIKYADQPEWVLNLNMPITIETKKIQPFSRQTEKYS